VEARVNLSEAGVDVEIEEAVADKGYHSTDTLELADWASIRTYIPERKPKGKRNWKDVPEEKRLAVINNRRRTRGARSKRLQRLRSERVERSFAHMCDTGGARRSWLCGLMKIQKRYLIAAVARNLGLIMRKLFAMGTARGLQAEGGLASSACFALLHIRHDLRRWWFVPMPRRTVSLGYATAG
jgi:transposase